MASFFESSNVFEQRVRDLGLATVWPEFERLGWTKFSVLAFASDFVPGTSPAELFNSQVVEPLVPVEADRPRLKPLLKRLFVEAYTMAAHDIQQRADAKDPEEPRKMPVAEREHRLGALQQRLVGITIDGEMRPSNRLIDLAAGMMDTGTVEYIPWESCTKRDQELVGVRTEKVWKADANGVVKESTESKAADATVGSDLLLRYALNRRGLALEIANVCAYEAHELLVEAYFDAMLAPALPGYSKVTRTQIKNADVYLWKEIGKKCPKGLVGTLGSRPPFEQALKDLLFDPKFRYMFMPLPSAGSSSAAAGNPQNGPGNDGHVKRLENQIGDLKRRIQSLAGSSQDPPLGVPKAPGAKRKRGGGGKGAGKKVTMDGKTRVHVNGEPLCFNFNTKGCANAQPGKKCSNGWHFCAEPGCGQPHAMRDNHA